MKLHQSDLKTWGKCPLMFKFGRVDGIQGEQSGSLTFGTIIHLAVLLLEKSRNLEGAIEWFHWAWRNPGEVERGMEPSYYVRGTSWEKYDEKGEAILRNWWGIIEWDGDVVLVREYPFEVPIGDHVLAGTVDKVAVRYLGKEDEHVVLVSDYKTTKKEPTYGYLAHDLQFHAYCYATTCPEFWDNLDNGRQIYEKYRDHKRVGEWVQLTGPRRKSAGERTEMHYNRLRYAVDHIATSIELRIFPPTVSGDTCLYCEYRGICGLPDREEEERTLIGTTPERSMTKLRELQLFG